MSIECVGGPHDGTVLDMEIVTSLTVSSRQVSDGSVRHDLYGLEVYDGTFRFRFIHSYGEAVR